MNIHITLNKYKNKGFEIKNWGAKLLIMLALFLIPNLSLAVSAQDILNAKNQLNQTTAEKKSLQGEVAVIDGQIGSIQSSISQTNGKIYKLNADINATQARMVQAEADLAKARLQLSDVITASYEYSQVSSLEALAQSKNFSDYVNRSEYLESIQLKIKGTANQVVALKTELDAKKAALVADKKKAEELKAQQIAQQNQVSSQRYAKDMILQETLGDEAAYQKLVKNLQAQYNAEQARIWNSGRVISGGFVKAGDIIGYIGNTGFSSGPHLHFEIRNSSQVAQNPNNYLGNGYFTNPAPGVWISQGYGTSSWTSAYSFHTGIDYADGGAGTPVRATADGEIVYRETGWGNTYPGQVVYGNYIKIRHTNGMYSLYGHLR